MEITVSAFRQHAGYEPAMDLADFEVRASDGRLGRIAGTPASARGSGAGVRHPESVLLPVSAIVSIDLTDRVVHLDRTREDILRGRSAGRGGVYYRLQGAATDGA